MNIVREVRPISDSEAYAALEQILNSKLQDAMAHASPFEKEQTSIVEAFNSVILMFAPKMHQFSYQGMVAR